MKIKEAEYTACGECGTRKHVASEEYGCDECKQPINRGTLGPKGNRQYLSASVFKKDDHSHSESLEFCSWECCLKGLAKVECDHFISPPYIIYDEEQEGIRAQDFFAAVKAFK